MFLSPLVQREAWNAIRAEDIHISPRKRRNKKKETCFIAVSFFKNLRSIPSRMDVWKVQYP